MLGIFDSVNRGIVGLIGSTRRVSFVQYFAKGTAGCKLHDWQIAGHLQAELVIGGFTFAALRFFGVFGSGLLCGLQDVIRYALEFINACVIHKSFGGIQGVFAEFLAQLGQAFLNLGKAFFGNTCELRATQNKIADCIFVCLLLLVIQCRHINRFVFGVQGFVRPQRGIKRRHFRQGIVIGSTKLWCIGDMIQMIHSTPNTSQLFSSHIQFFGYV